MIYSMQNLNILQNCHLNIGLYFGSFDPFHNGHLMVVNNALKLLKLDYLLIIIAKKHIYKNYTTSICDRAKLAESLTRNNRSIIVTNIEDSINNSQCSYHTLKYLTDKFPKLSATMIIGADLADQVALWYRFDQIFDIVNVAIFDRRSYHYKVGNSKLAKKFELVVNSNINFNKIVFYRYTKLVDISSSTIKQSKII